MERLYLITVNWGGVPNIAGLERALHPLGTWLRFSQTSWLLWTFLDAQGIYSAVATVLTKADAELIMGIDQANWTGFGQPWIWTWINSRGTKTT